MGRAETDSLVLSVGQTLGGKYRLEGELGKGAMGTVWAATHVSLHQKVAIKVISSEHADSDELRQRFDTEARAAAKLRSRFVVGVYDHGQTKDGLPYIVMEYLEGECLEDRIARQGAIPIADTARIARHVSRALGKAHANGIVHRDLKPANIYMATVDDDDDDDWVAKVLDFGIAKMDDFGDRSTTKTGAVLGTPLFMSPEQVRGASAVDSRADLYSLGMVIYNMLTGTFAFEGQSFGDLLVSICTDPLPRLSDRAPHIPPTLDAWFQRACARDPDDRYQTASEMMRGFSEAVGSIDDSRLSIADLSSTTLKLASPQLAETFAANSAPGTQSATGQSTGPTHSHHGRPAVSAIPPTTRSDAPDEIGITGTHGTGTATVTINEERDRSRLLPIGLALGAAATVGLIFFLASGKGDSISSPEVMNATTMDVNADVPVDGPAVADALGAQVLEMDEEAAGLAVDGPAANGNTADDSTTDQPAADNHASPKTPAKARPSSTHVKPATKQPVAQPASTPSQPTKPSAPAPAATTPPASSEPDIGF